MSYDYLQTKKYFTNNYWLNSLYSYFTRSLVYSLSPQRIYLVEIEDRTLDVPLECRSYFIEQEDRTLDVTE